MEPRRTFPDTNTLLHFRSFDEVEWAQIANASNVMLILAPVVLRELDALKDLHQVKRLRHRARALVSKLSHLIETGLEHQLRPNVQLRFEPTDPTIDFGQHHLKQNLKDDELIASIIQHRLTQPAIPVALVTHDLGLKMKARFHNIETLAMPDSLKLTDEPDDEQRTIRALQTKLAEYEDRMPLPRVAFLNGNGRLDITCTREVPITEDLLEQELALYKLGLEVSHNNRPLETLFPPSQAQTDRYKADLETHLEGYATYIRARHSARAERARTITLELQLLNEGRAPADDVDVILKFPVGLELSTDDPGPEDPTAPKPPHRPSGGAFGVLESLHAAADLARPRLLIPEFFGGSLRADWPNLNTNVKGHEVHVHLRRAKHGQPHSLGTLFVTFASQDEMRPLTIEYGLQAANIPSRIEGQLHLILRLADEPISSSNHEHG